MPLFSLEFMEVIQLFKDNHIHGSDFLQLDNYPIFGRGIKTTSSVVNNSKILTIPKEFIISVDKAKNDFTFGSILNSLTVTLSDDNILSLYLLFIRNQTSGYKFEKTYINSLPVKYDTYYFFNSEEIEPSVGSSIYKISVKLKNQITDDFEILKKEFSNHFIFTKDEVYFKL